MTEFNFDEKAKELDIIVDNLNTYYGIHIPNNVNALIDRYVIITQEGCSDEEFLHLYKEVNKAWENRTSVEYIEEESVNLPF